MNILGISAYFHDSAAALIRDGRILAAAQEERFSRKKQDPRFPHHAIEFCLRSQGINGNEIDQVVFYEKPLLTFERIMETQLAVAPWGARSFSLSLPVWAKKKLFLKSVILSELEKCLGVSFKDKLFFSEHHLSHAASAFFPSPFEDAAILTVDGVGEWACGSIAHGRGNQIEILKEMLFPHSWGLFYSTVTGFLGFKVNSGEYKMMGLAPFGQDGDQTQKFQQLFETEILSIEKDGALRLNLDHFAFHTGDRMYRRQNWEKIFGIRQREPETPLTQEQANLALAAQRVLEKGLLLLAKEARRLTSSPNLVMAGGVALNCVANAKIMKAGIFDKVWIQPASDDSGGALGAALALSHIKNSQARPKPQFLDHMQGAYLGPSYSDQEVILALRKWNVPCETFTNTDDLCLAVSGHLNQNLVVGWFQGRMEYGPRALGNRSILAAAKDSEMQKKLNLKIKYRESFRPFAPAVLFEEVANYFDFRDPAPYMLATAQVQPKILCEKPKHYSDMSISEKLSFKRSEVSSITHMDDSARIQTVHKETNPLFHKLISTYQKLAGVPILINTSFNVRGEPIVCSPEDALRCFINTEMDILCLGMNLVRKSDLKNSQLEQLRAQLKTAFALD